MATLKKAQPKNEKELHSIIEKELEAIEEGLRLLKYEYELVKGNPDFLCADSGGRLVIIEVKLQEDENMLFQALRYYNEIDRNRYIIAKMFSKKTVDPEDHPRIILIAESFSDDLRRMGTLVVPDVEMYEYTVLKTEDGKEGICYHAVSLPKIEDKPVPPKTADELVAYMTKGSLVPAFEKVKTEIKSFNKEIEEYVTQGYIGFKYRGRQIAFLVPHRKSYDIGASIIDEDGHTTYDYQRIESGTEDYTDILRKISKSFENLLGKK